MIGPALQARGGIGGYVTKGRFWIMFLSPNMGYASQMKAAAGDAFYIPSDVYVTILGLDDENEAVLGVSKKLGKEDEVGVFVPFGPILSTVHSDTLQACFGWNEATANAFASLDLASYGGKSYVPGMVEYAEGLGPDEVICPDTNPICEEQEAEEDLTLVYGNAVGVSEENIVCSEECLQGGDDAFGMAEVALGVGCLNFLALIALTSVLVHRTCGKETKDKHSIHAKHKASVVPLAVPLRETE